MNPVDYTISPYHLYGRGWYTTSYIRVSYQDSFATYRKCGELNETYVFNPMILSKDMQCGEGELLMNYDHTCGYREYGETFKLYEGLDTESENSIVLAENNCLASHRYICLKPVIHTIVMTTVYNGWYSNEGVQFTYVNSSVSFSVRFEDSGKRVFNMAQLILSQCSEGQLPVHLLRKCGYAHGSQEGFEISEGSFLLPQNEPIYSQDTCINVNTYLCLNPVNYTLIMKDTYHDGWYSDSLLELDLDNKTLPFHLKKGTESQQVFNPKSLEVITPIPSQCIEGQIPIHIQRSCENDVNDQESFEIHEGLEIRPQEEAVYYQDSCTSIDAVICLYPTEYTIIMRDIKGNGWNANSNFNISYDNSYLVFQKSSGFNELQTFNVSSMELTRTDISGDCQQIYDLDNRTSMLHVAKNACNDIDLTTLSTSRFRDLQTLWIEDDNFMYVKQFNISNNALLTNVIIAANSFTQKKYGYGSDASKSLKIMNCGLLRNLEIGLFSFSDYKHFELKNLPSLQSITMGIYDSNRSPRSSYNFLYSSFYIRGKKLILCIEL